MKSERFKRTKSSDGDQSPSLLVVAALVMGVSSLVLGPKPASSQRTGFDLTSGLRASQSPATSTPRPPAQARRPRSTQVHPLHRLQRPQQPEGDHLGQSITTALDTTNYPAPPADCRGPTSVLPTFSGSFNVLAGGDTTSPGVPIELKDNGRTRVRVREPTPRLQLHGQRQVHRGLRDHDAGLRPTPRTRASASPTRPR